MKLNRVLFALTICYIHLSEGLCSDESITRNDTINVVKPVKLKQKDPPVRDKLEVSINGGKLDLTIRYPYLEQQIGIFLAEDEEMKKNRKDISPTSIIKRFTGVFRRTVDIPRSVFYVGYFLKERPNKFVSRWKVPLPDVVPKGKKANKNITSNVKKRTSGKRRKSRGVFNGIAKPDNSPKVKKNKEQRWSIRNVFSKKKGKRRKTKIENNLGLSIARNNIRSDSPPEKKLDLDGQIQNYMDNDELSNLSISAKKYARYTDISRNDTSDEEKRNSCDQEEGDSPSDPESAPTDDGSGDVEYVYEEKSRITVTPERSGEGQGNELIDDSVNGTADYQDINGGDKEIKRDIDKSNDDCSDEASKMGGVVAGDYPSDLKNQNLNDDENVKDTVTEDLVAGDSLSDTKNSNVKVMKDSTDQSGIENESDGLENVPPDGYYWEFSNYWILIILLIVLVILCCTKNGDHYMKVVASLG
eukprot:941731_1